MSPLTPFKQGANVDVQRVLTPWHPIFQYFLYYDADTFSFLNGNTFSAKVNGIPFSGSYVYNPQNGEITLKTSTETLKGNVIRTQKGMGLMFNSTQMVNLLQKEGKVSNTAAIQAVSNLAKSANGARVGFELTK